MMQRSVFLYFLLVLCETGAIHAADYYVSWRTGNDTNSGLSSEAPWKSIARVNSASLNPGDRILLHAGETWREQLRPPTSGEENHPIVFTSYGAGARPKLEGDRGDTIRSKRASLKEREGKTQPGDVAIDNNDQSHIVYDGLELRHVLEGFRIYVWSATVRDILVQNCVIQVEDATGAGIASAAVYANVKTGTILDLRIIGNHLIPYPRRLDHWGIYLVGGVQHFRIHDNTLGPAGEDGITVWHSAFGEITHNQGGGNGENTIDVKDSHDITIRDNDADLDQEYNIVVHGVDASDSTYNIHVEDNRCSRGGQGGQLSAGIALLFVQKSGIDENLVEFAFGPGILIKDSGSHPDNWASGNRLTGNGTGQKLPAIVLQDSPTAQIRDNQIVP